MTPDLILTFAAIITALGVIVAMIVSLYKLARRIDAALGVDAQGRTLSDRLDRVEHQLWENGGGSLADRVNNIEHHVIKTSAEINLIKDLTLGLRSTQLENTAPNMITKLEEPLIKKRAARIKKVS